MCVCVCVCVCDTNTNTHTRLINFGYNVTMSLCTELSVCVCRFFGLIWLRRCYIDIYTFQQLSCDGERDALSRNIRKANHSAWFDQILPYETIAC